MLRHNEIIYCLHTRRLAFLTTTSTAEVLRSVLRLPRLVGAVMGRKSLSSRGVLLARTSAIVGTATVAESGYCSGPRGTDSSRGTNMFWSWPCLAATEPMCAQGKRSRVGMRHVQGTATDGNIDLSAGVVIVNVTVSEFPLLSSTLKSMVVSVSSILMRVRRALSSNFTLSR